jgi:hypothetical protein
MKAPRIAGPLIVVCLIFLPAAAWGQTVVSGTIAGACETKNQDFQFYATVHFIQTYLLN